MNNIKINALTNMLVRILNIVFPIITGPYISRILSKEDYGNFNVANTFLNIFIPFATLGIYNYGIREISKVKDNITKINKTFSELFFVSLFSSVTATIVYYIYIVFFTDLGNLKTIYYILGFQIFSQLFNIEWVNEAFENYKFILYKTLIIRVGMLVSIFAFVKKADDIIPYTIIMTVINFLNFLMSFIWIKRKVSIVRINISNLKPLIGPLFAVLLIANANMLYTYLDQLFLSNFNLVENVTYYILGYNLVTIIARVVSGAVSVSVPRLGYYLGANKYKEYQDLVNTSSKVLFFFLVPMSIGLFVIGKPITLLYAGEKYYLAGICTMLFAIRTVGWALEIIFGTQVILVRGYEQRLTILYFTGGGVNLILNSILYFNGIASPEYYIITTIIAEAVLLTLEYLFIKKNRLVNTKIILKNISRYIIVSCGFIPLAYIVSIFFKVQMKVDKMLIKNIGVTMIVCSIYYIIMMYILNDEIFNTVISGIKKKIKGKARA